MDDREENTQWVNHLSDAKRRRFRLYAYSSTWVGCFSDVMLESSAIIILYMVMLGADNTLVMLSTGLIGIVSMGLLIPSSSIIERFGPKRVVAVSCVVAGGAYLLMAAAPWFGMKAAPYIVFTGIFLFSLSKPLANGAWYPILSNILRPEERSGFFGTMRFSYYILTGGVFALLGVVMGKKPPVVFLQIVIAATGLLAFARNFFIAKIELPEIPKEKSHIRETFSISVKNAPLVGFSIYAAFMCFAFSAVLPLALLYLKNGLHYHDNVIQILSSIGIAGSIAGYFIYSRIVKKTGLKKLQIFIHFMYILVPFGFFISSAGGMIGIFLFGLLLFAGNMAFAFFSCVFSQEVLALARPGNATMAAAFAQTYQMVGTAAGRTSASLLLSNGIIASTWSIWGAVFTNFQTLFLLSGCFALFCFTLIFSVPCIVPKHDDYYRP